VHCFDANGRFHPARVRAGGLRANGLGIATERIAAGGSGHGHLVLISPDRPLTQDDLHVLERAATVAALAITKAEAVAAVESKYSSDFLRDVLTARAGSPHRMVEHARSLGWEMTVPMVVVVGELDDVEVTSLTTEDLRDLDSRLTRAWIRAVRGAFKNAPAAGFRDEVVALLPIPEGAESAQIIETVTRFVDAAQEDRTSSLPMTFSVGISRTVRDLAALPQAYEHARRALSVGRRVHGNGRVMSFDAMGVFRLLALVENNDELTRFAEDNLGVLVTQRSAEHEDLLETLRVLLDAGMNIAEAARLLHFHYNTLRYRITKIESLIGPFTTDSQLRLRILLALQVLEMRGP
jgi:purine catabolism regulator